MPSAQIPWRGPGSRPARPAPPPRPDAAAPRRPDAQALALRRRLRRGADALRGPRRGRPARPVLLGDVGSPGAPPRRPHHAAPGQPRGDDGRAQPRDRLARPARQPAPRRVAPIESICPSGSGWGWTRKRAGVPIEGTVEVPGQRWEVAAHGVDDESAGYHQRHTSWHWSAGVGARRRRPRARLEPGRGHQRPGREQRARDLGRRRAPGAAPGPLRRHRRRSTSPASDSTSPPSPGTPATRTSSCSAPATATASAPSPAPSPASTWPRASASWSSTTPSGEDAAGA